MPPLSPEEFGPGRQIKRGGTTLDILDSVQGSNGGQFVFAREGDTVQIISTTDLRGDDTEYEAVDEEERQAKAREAEEKRQAEEAKDREQYEEYKKGQKKDGPETPTPKKK